MKIVVDIEIDALKRFIDHGRSTVILKRSSDGDILAVLDDEKRIS